MKQIFWSRECADNFLSRQHGKNDLEFCYLFTESQRSSHDWLLVRGGVKLCLSLQRTWSRVERKAVEQKLLMAQVSYWTTWESPRDFPLLAANTLVKSRWRELLLCLALCQGLPLLCLRTTKLLSKGLCTSLFCLLQRNLQRAAPGCRKGRAPGMLRELQHGKHAWC